MENNPAPAPAPPLVHAAAALEAGELLRWGPPAFPLTPQEQALIADGRVVGRAKNISYDRAGGLRHAEADPETLQLLSGMLGRFNGCCETLLQALLPEYAGGIEAKRASFRPAEIAGRAASWRRDDTRRHIDAFPSAPTGGKRILRVFCNVDQAARPRLWRIGPDFESYVEALLPAAPIRRIPGLGRASAWLGVTKSRRTLYDAQMLALHDAAKRDLDWQRTAPAQALTLLPGEMWMVFTDLVPHAVLSGCNALEQTFLIDPARMVAPERSPLAVLSRRSGRDLRQPA